MNPWTVLLVVFGAVSAHHGQLHPLQGTALGYSAAPRVTLQPSYAIPVRFYTASPAPQPPVYPVVAAIAPTLPLPAPVYSIPLRTFTPRYQPPTTDYRQYVKPAAILRQSQVDNVDGSFSYDFQTENGISTQARGYVKNPGTAVESQVIEGQFSYTAPDGTPIATRYYADDTGFHAEGAHLPVPPAAPLAHRK